MITQNELKRLFDYKDGFLVWRVSLKNNVMAGEQVGCMCGGYVQTRINGVPYYLHRLIWLWHKGYIPEGVIDHIDRSRINNKIENLREVSALCNLRNAKQSVSNTSGVKGVSFCRADRKWRAQINLGNRTLSISTSTDFTEAVAHRLAAEQCLNWAGCDCSSPASQHMKEYVNGS